ncbi:zinc transporter 1-like [Fagus crenata]
MINLQVCSFNYILNLLFLLIIFLPTIYGDCTCDDVGNTKNDNSTALKYKLGSIASILVASAVGVSIPLLGKKLRALRPENDFFFIIEAFAAGVILVSGFNHVLSDAFVRLTSPCLNKNPWGSFPFTGFFAMVSSIGTFMLGVTDEERDNEHEGHIHLHTHATHDHAHRSTNPSEGTNLPEVTRHRVIAQVLELGIVFHSIIIGVDLGASKSVATIRPLLAALSAAIMSIFFSLTTPVGIAIGIGASSTYKDNSPTDLIVEGTFNALAAGILIFMALVDLLAADFMNPRVQPCE